VKSLTHLDLCIPCLYIPLSVIYVMEMDVLGDGNPSTDKKMRIWYW